MSESKEWRKRTSAMKRSRSSTQMGSCSSNSTSLRSFFAPFIICRFTEEKSANSDHPQSEPTILQHALHSQKQTTTCLRTLLLSIHRSHRTRTTAQRNKSSIPHKNTCCLPTPKDHGTLHHTTTHVSLQPPATIFLMKLLILSHQTSHTDMQHRVAPIQTN